MANSKVKLGKALKDEAGVVHGRIGGLGIGSVDFISEEATSLEGKPYLKLIADPTGDAYEVGAAFPKIKDGMAYYSVNLESPVLPAPISAALFPDKNNANAFNLIWNRPEQPKASADATAENGQADNAAMAAQQKRHFFARKNTPTP